MRDLVQHESLGERGAVRGVRLCDAILLAQSARATLLHYAKCACAEQHSHSSVARSATIRNGSSERRAIEKGKPGGRELIRGSSGDVGVLGGLERAVGSCESEPSR